MFWHNFKYELLRSFRVKDVLVWLIIFPIALGTFFKLAFGNLYDGELTFKAVPVAVVEQGGEDKNFREVAGSLSQGDDAILSVTYADEQKALEMLKDEDVNGIIYVGEQLSLTVSSNGLKSTILESFVERYNLSAKIIADIAASDPAKIPDVAKALAEEVSTVKAQALSSGNTNMYDQYFFNLLAMVALFGSMAGLHVAVENQGNLSPLGARKCISPTPKLRSILASLCGTFVLQTACMIIAVTFIITVLRVDMGDRLALVYLTAILSGFVGCSMGFAIGSISRLSASTKNALLTPISLLFCFFSGLMAGDMKQRVAESSFAWFNKINPAAVICESFFSLNIYEDYTRFIRCIVTMAITVVVFISIGFFCTRRRKYASL